MRETPGMGVLDQLTDPYSRTARLVPATLVVFPLAVFGVLAVPPAVTVWGRVAALVFACGAPFVVTQVVRDLGVRVEPKLFGLWGGRPTEVMLRWSGPSTPATLSRQHELIKEKLGIDLPDAATEQADPAAAEAEYEVAVGALRERTRDDAQFGLVKRELTAYGFWRNTYAVRRFGMITCTGTAILTVVLALLGAVPLGWKQQVGFALLDAAACVAWWRIPTAEAVRRAAERYARQLLQALESLKPPEAPKPPQGQPGAS